MTEERINWRSFADDGTITRHWNAPATPTFYVVDHTGMIHRKWVGNPGGKTIDVALEKLIREAEETNAPK